MKKKFVTYEFESALKDRQVHSARFTLGTLTLGELGEYSKLARIYALHVEQLIGGKWEKLTEEEKDKADPEAVALSRMWQRWAYIKPCIKRVEVKDTESSPWVDSDLEYLGFDSLEGLNFIGLDLFEALDESAQKCNPGMFGPARDESDDPNAKKSLVVE